MSGGLRGSSGRGDDGLDPAVDGARYQLTPAVASKIWHQVCGEATDARGRRDMARARKRFHEVAARVAQGAALEPTPGKISRVELLAAGGGRERDVFTGGRSATSPVDVEARRITATRDVAGPSEAGVLPHEQDVDRLFEATRLSPTPPSGAAAPSGASAGLGATSLDVGVTGSKTTDDAFTGGGAIPYRAEMERAFGHDFGSVRARLGAAEPLDTVGAVGAARGEEIAFSSAKPDRAAVAHELAHVVQRRQASSVKPSTPVEAASSAAEQEADVVAARVAAGERAPPITQVPTGVVARMIPSREPPPPARVAASAWIDHMLVLSPLRIDVITHLAAARLPSVHPRLAWNAAAHLASKVWGTVGNAARLQLAVAPLDLLARIDQMRELDDNGAAHLGPLKYVPEVALTIARELETAVRRCVERLGPRLVAAFDASLAAGDRSDAQDASIVPPDALVFSHPIDRIVEDIVRQGAIATIRPRRRDEDEPAPHPVAPGRLRPVTYRWAEDAALWNWIRTDPPDATPEEVAQQVLGSSTRAFELRGSAPFFALPAGHVKHIAPDRAGAAAIKAGSTVHQPGSQQAFDELSHGVSEAALAPSKVGEAAGLAQAEHAARGAPHVDAADATDLAGRCRSQVHLIVDSYRDFGAGARLAAMAARLTGRIERLPTMPAIERAQFTNLFAQQSSVLYAVAGDLETLTTQVRKLQPPDRPKSQIDPTLAEIADLVLEAGACSDLPETAHRYLERAHARHALIPFDAMDAMLDDARARTVATDELAGPWGPGDAGSTKISPPMTGRQQWDDLRGRERRLSEDVLAARRAHDANTQQPSATQTLTERTRALQIEARVVAAETQCGYMADKLAEEEGVVAAIAGQMRDLQHARNTLRALATRMAGIRIRWREKHAQLFALAESHGRAETGPAAAIRRAIVELESELARVGDEKTQAALKTAQSELKDMAIARAVADIAVMIGITLATSGLGTAAAGAARGLGIGRTAAQLVNVATQSVAMATLRTMLYHDSFSSAFGSELLTNFAGLAALRGVAAGLSKLKLGRALGALKQGDGAWKYIAHGTELAIEAVTQAGIQFATAQAESLVRQGRSLNDDELKMLAIQGMGMFLGNAIAHRLTSPALDAITAFAAKVGKPYRRAKVRGLAERVGQTGDPEASKELLREERALVAEELALLEQIAHDHAERAQFGEKTLATVTEQAHHHRNELGRLGVEHALQHGLTEISPGKAWEGPASQVEPALANARAAGASVHAEQIGDGTRRYLVTIGANHYMVYERRPAAPSDANHSGTPDTHSHTSQTPNSTTTEKQPVHESSAPAADWVKHLKAQMTPTEQEKFEQIRGRRSDDDVQRQFGGDVDKALAMVRKASGEAAETARLKEASQLRAEQIRAWAKAKGIMKTQEINELIQGLPANPQRKDIAKIAQYVRSKLIGQLRAQELAERYPGAEVLREVTVLTEEAMTSEQYRAASRENKQGLTLRRGADGRDSVYRRVTDIDALVTDKPLAPGTKAKMVRLDQEKTGETDMPSKADTQNDNAVAAILAASNGGKRVILELGTADITDQIDLASISSADKVSVGPANKKFKESLGIIDSDLDRLVKELIAGAIKEDAQ